jgi:flagellar assembly protein FliH
MSYRARPLSEASVEPFTWDTIEEATAGRAAKPAAAAQRDAAEEEMRLATLERDAFAKGYAQGERAGTEASATRTEGMLKRLGQTIEELAALRGTIVRRTERQTVQLVLAIAERVVQREIALDRSLLVGMARAALDRLGEYGSATIRLHPEDFRVIANSAVAAEGAPVRIQADAVVPRGGCLVQSDFGFMDVSPEAQFRELARTLLADDEAVPMETGSVRL